MNNEASELLKSAIALDKGLLTNVEFANHIIHLYCSGTVDLHGIECHLADRHLKSLYERLVALSTCNYLLNVTVFDANGIVPKHYNAEKLKTLHAFLYTLQHRME